MKTIIVNGKEYKLEFTFAAAEHRELVQKMFNIKSGAYFARQAKQDADNGAELVIDGVSSMVADIPCICVTAFYAGLLENNPLTPNEAKELMKEYMKENKLSYDALYEEMNQCMEDDGFFDLSGITGMVKKMNSAAEEQVKKVTKKPQDNKTKSVSAK